MTLSLPRSWAHLSSNSSTHPDEGYDLANIQEYGYDLLQLLHCLKKFRHARHATQLFGGPVFNLNLFHLILDILKCGDAEFAALLSCEIILELFQCLLEHGIRLHVDDICVFSGANMCNRTVTSTLHSKSIKTRQLQDT